MVMTPVRCCSRVLVLLRVIGSVVGSPSSVGRSVGVVLYCDWPNGGSRVFLGAVRSTGAVTRVHEAGSATAVASTGVRGPSVVIVIVAVVVSGATDRGVRASVTVFVVGARRS